MNRVKLRQVCISKEFDCITYYVFEWVAGMALYIDPSNFESSPSVSC